MALRSPPHQRLYRLIIPFLAFTLPIRAQAPLEPSDGHVLLGAWVDTGHQYNDTPTLMNTRMGRNLSSFQLSQTIPVTPYDWVLGSGGTINETYVELTGTSASVFLTVYPSSLASIADADLTALGQQIASYQASPYNRQVFLRWAPEMQGDWFRYGGQPTEYTTQWRRMHDAIKALAPGVAIVWAPNGAQGYPYGITLDGSTSAADRTALDTNNDGTLSRTDDAYSPYYPGDGYVDWCGLSWYWKGESYPYTVNQAQPAGYADGAMTGVVPPGAAGFATAMQWTPFYETYCSSKNKPCMFTEMGAAYHVNQTDTGTASKMEIQQAWWRNTLTNLTFYETYPKMKMMMLFEHEKVEDLGDLRDFRITADDSLRSAFLADLTADPALLARFAWAAPQAVPAAALASAGLPTATASSRPGGGGQGSAAPGRLPTGTGTSLSGAGRTRRGAVDAWAASAVAVVVAGVAVGGAGVWLRI